MLEVFDNKIEFKINTYLSNTNYILKKETINRIHVFEFKNKIRDRENDHIYNACIY